MKHLFKEKSHHFRYINNTQEHLNKSHTSAAQCAVVGSGWFVSVSLRA